VCVCVGRKGVTALLCFICRAAAFYSAFPEPPLHLPIISIENHTLLIAVIKNRGFFCPVPAVGVFLPGSAAPEPVGSGARAPVGSSGCWLPARDSHRCQDLRCRPLSKREPDTKTRQNPGQLQPSHTSAPFGDLHRGARMSCALI